MPENVSQTTCQHIHIVTLRCKGEEAASNCLEALKAYGRPDALTYGCDSYVFGRNASDRKTVVLVEHWSDFGKLDRLLEEKVVPALPTYNALLERDFDPARDTVRITLA